MKSYSLLENSTVHTSNLAYSEAIEMKERHERFFPDCKWEVVEDKKTANMERSFGLMERQKRAFRK